jgi:hypothetical protein
MNDKVLHLGDVLMRSTIYWDYILHQTSSVKSYLYNFKVKLHKSCKYWIMYRHNREPNLFFNLFVSALLTVTGGSCIGHKAATKLMQ